MRLYGSDSGHRTRSSQLGNTFCKLIFPNRRGRAAGAARGLGRCTLLPHGGAVGAILARHHSCVWPPAGAQGRASQLRGLGVNLFLH